MPRGIDGGIVIVIEVVSEPHQARVIGLVEIAVGVHGPDVDHAILRRRVKVGAESVQPHRPPAAGRAQETDGRQQAQHGGVVRAGFSGKTVEHVPFRGHAVLLTPFQQLNVAQGRRAFLHQLQDVVVQALNARLDPPDAGVAEQVDLLPAEVGFYLVEKLQGPLPLGQGRQHIAKVFHVEDIVDRFDILDPPALDQILQLLQGTPRALAAERHGAAVQTAKRAVRLGAPPAAARRFEQQRGHHVGAAGALFKAGEIIAEVRDSQRVQVAEQWRRPGGDGPAVRPIDDAANCLTGLPAEQLSHQGRETFLCLAGAGVVHEWKLPVQLQAHVPFPVGPAEDDRDLGVRGLDPPGQRQRCDILFESGGETHDGAVAPGHQGHAVVEVVRGQGPDSEDAADVVLPKPPRLPEHLLHVALIDHRPVPIQSGRKHPVAGEGRVRQRRLKPLVFAVTDQLREGEGKVANIARDRFPGQRGLEQAEPQRRALQGTKRHTDEQDLLHGNPR